MKKTDKNGNGSSGQMTVEEVGKIVGKMILEH